MDQAPAIAQWTMDITVWHGATFGHRVTCRVLGKAGGWVDVGTWYWTGLGVPGDLVDDLQARLASVITEHLVTRYGVAGQLDVRWAGEAGST